VEIGVAHTTGFGLDQNLADPWRGNLPFLQHQGHSELLGNCGLHFSGHHCFLFSG
jgi:hypothetical protein